MHACDFSVSELACMCAWVSMCAYLLRFERCPQCSVAGYGTNILPAFTTRKQACQRMEELCMLHLDSQKCSCTRVWDPRKLHVSIYENVQTIVSWLLLAFKGLNDSQYTYAPFFSDRHSKTLCALLRTCTQIVIGIFFVWGNGNTHVCLTLGWNLFYFDECHI